MVHWLVYPTELARVPDEIELMHTIPVNEGNEDTAAEYYLFRFRTFEPHWAAKDGWMVGWVGPFLLKNVPTIDGDGQTFSEFTPWDSKTPDEHIHWIQDTLSQFK